MDIPLAYWHTEKQSEKVGVGRHLHCSISNLTQDGLLGGPGVTSFTTAGLPVLFDHAAATKQASGIFPSSALSIAEGSCLALILSVCWCYWTKATSTNPSASLSNIVRGFVSHVLGGFCLDGGETTAGELRPIRKFFFLSPLKARSG